MNHLTLVNKANPKTSRKVRASEPAIPRAVTRALKQLESGDADVVCVIASGKSENRVYQVSAGKGAGFLRDMNLPYMEQESPIREGNLITLKPRPNNVDQILAIARAFASGYLETMHLIASGSDGKVVNRTFKQSAGRVG